MRRKRGRSSSSSSSLSSSSSTGSSTAQSLAASENPSAPTGTSTSRGTSGSYSRSTSTSRSSSDCSIASSISSRLQRKRVVSFYKRPVSKRTLDMALARTFTFAAARGEACTIISMCGVRELLLVVYADDGPFQIPLLPDPTGRAKWMQHEAPVGGQAKRGALLIDPIRYDSLGDIPVSPTRRSVLPSTMLRLGSSVETRWRLDHKVVSVCCFPGATEKSRDIAVGVAPAAESLVVFQRPGPHVAVSPVAVLPLPNGVVPLSVAAVPFETGGAPAARRCAVGTMWHDVLLVSLHTAPNKPLSLTTDVVLSTLGYVGGCFFPVTCVSVVQCGENPLLQVHAASAYSFRVVCWEESDWTSPRSAVTGGSSIVGLVSGSSPLLATVAGKVVEARKHAHEAMRLPGPVTQVSPVSVFPSWRRERRSRCGLGEIAAFAIFGSRRIVVAERFSPRGNWRTLGEYSAPSGNEKENFLGLTWLEAADSRLLLVCLLGASELAIFSLSAT